MDDKPNIKQIYKMYGSATPYYTQYKDFYEDKDGYPNLKAYENFIVQLDSEYTYYLACISIDLKYANSINFAYGNYVLRKIINGIRSGLKHCYVFRIQGDKFNVLIRSDSLEDFKAYIDSPKDYCTVYCGLVEDSFSAERNYEIVQKGISLMFQDRYKKKNTSNNMIYGNKQNVPIELQETDTRKHRKTMWYAVIDLIVNENNYKSAKIYVYPTKFCPALQSVPIIAVIDNALDYRVFYGNFIIFGLGGVKFALSARYDREAHFNVQFFREDESEHKEKGYEYKINIVEGECIPVNFGKRIGKDEIYPIKKNVEGLCDYVLFKNAYLDDDEQADHDPQIVTSGIVEKDGIKYGVYIDEQFIDLIELDK